MKATIYAGEFGSRDCSTSWRAEIWEERETPPSSVGELTFPGEEPLVIEWPETGKEEVLCGSTATLKVLSPGDRTYAGLYTIKSGRIGLRVLRNGVLYWSGTLDPEFYEEPYCDTEDYEVLLTFSDFGILDRLKYDSEGLQTLSSIVSSSLERACIEYLDLNELISSRLSGYSRVMGLADVSVRSDNFTDEEGEVMSLHDVLEGILQPFGLRMVQRSGSVWIYDLNALYRSGDGGYPSVRWHDKDQVLSVDKVSNSVKVTFSPYGGSDVVSQEVSYLGAVDNDAAVPDANTDAATVEKVTYYKDGNIPSSGDAEDYSFTIFTSGEGGDGVGATLGEHARYFHIEPIYGGSKHDGIAWGFTIRELSEFIPLIGKRMMYSLPKNQAVNALSEDTADSDHDYNSYGRYRPWEAVLKTYRVWLPKVSAEMASRLLLRLRVETLMDVRHNPFEEASDDNNCKNDWEWAQGHANLVRIPIGVRLYDDNGNILRHWENLNAGNQFTETQSAMLASSYGSWIAGDYSGDGWRCWAEWYDAAAADESSGCGGWKTNRQAMSFYDIVNGVGIDYSSLPANVRNLDEGQLIAYPAGSSGWLEVTVYSTVEAYGREGNKMKEDNSAGFRKRLRWQLYKSPLIDLVWSDNREAVEQADVEYKGEINADAQDELSLDTVCGTAADPLPTAKGLYYDSGSGLPLGTVERGGRTDCVEQLLIGTLHSQFGDRHVKLSGTVHLLSDGLWVYGEAMQGARRFMVTGDIQDMDAGTSEAVLVELSPDEYVKR